jgi:hypothetical protein
MGARGLPIQDNGSPSEQLRLTRYERDPATARWTYAIANALEGRRGRKRRGSAIIHIPNKSTHRLGGMNATDVGPFDGKTVELAFDIDGAGQRFLRITFCIAEDLE